MIDCEVHEISAVINKGMLLLGIKGDKLPTQFESTYMVQMMRQDYPNLPLGELDLAFELMAKNKLDENPETYQNFSVLYLSRLMTSYARWAARQIYEHKNDEVKQISGPQVDEDEIIRMSYDSFKRTRKFDEIFMALKTFNILHSRGLIITDPDIVVPLVEIELNKRIDSPKMKKEINRIINDDDQMELYCRRMAVSLYFKSLNNE